MSNPELITHVPSQQELAAKRQEKIREKLKNKYVPHYYDTNDVSEMRATRYTLPGSEASVLGIARGRYVNDKNEGVNIVQPDEDSDTLYEVVNGEVRRTLAGQFMIGESVNVPRGSDVIDEGWTVDHVYTVNGQDRVVVVKDQFEKEISADKLRSFNVDVELPNMAAEKEARLVRRQAILGGAATSGIIDVPDYIKSKE